MHVTFLKPMDSLNHAVKESLVQTLTPFKIQTPKKQKKCDYLRLHSFIQHQLIFECTETCISIKGGQTNFEKKMIELKGKEKKKNSCFVS